MNNVVWESTFIYFHFVECWMLMMERWQNSAIYISYGLLAFLTITLQGLLLPFLGWVGTTWHVFISFLDRYLTSWHNMCGYWLEASFLQNAFFWSSRGLMLCWLVTLLTLINKCVSKFFWLITVRKQTANFKKSHYKCSLSKVTITDNYSPKYRHTTYTLVYCSVCKQVLPAQAPCNKCMERIHIMKFTTLRQQSKTLKVASLVKNQIPPQPKVK